MELPREAGRHNLIALINHFASTNFPSETPYGGYIFRNCLIESCDQLLHYAADEGPLMSGAYPADITFENTVLQDMRYPAYYSPQRT